MSSDRAEVASCTRGDATVMSVAQETLVPEVLAWGGVSGWGGKQRKPDGRDEPVRSGRGMILPPPPPRYFELQHHRTSQRCTMNPHEKGEGRHSRSGSEVVVTLEIQG
jgi:hypothetical protein